MITMQVPEWLANSVGTGPPLGLRMPIDHSCPVYIYVLVDPTTRESRYIGKSIRPKERLQNHMNERSRCHRSNWLQSLKARGLQPEMLILEEIHGAWPWQEAERFWIAYGREQGWPLTNNTSGGDGVSDLPLETRKRMRQTWLGRKHKPETIEKLKTSRPGFRHSDETKSKMSAAHSGRTITWGAKISDANHKLTESEAEGVQQRLLAGERVIDLAVELGMSRTTISKIKLGRYRGKPD